MVKKQVFTKQDRAAFLNLHCFVETTQNSFRYSLFFRAEKILQRFNQSLLFSTGLLLAKIVLQTAKFRSQKSTIS